MLLRFLRDLRGNILPTFAITLVPLVVATGAVVDYTNAFDQRSLVQDAMDAAALAAGKQVGFMDTDELKAEAESFYLANVGTGKISNVPDLNTEITGSTVDVTTELHVPTYFLGIIGLDEFVFDLHTQVTIAMGTLEVALALDNSGSMSGSKIETLKEAAIDLVGTLHDLGESSTKPDPIKIGLAPFAASVNVGSANAGAAWMDTASQGTYHADIQKANGADAALNNLTLFSGLKDSSGDAITWGGCVEERPMPYDVSDDPATDAANPTAEEAKTLFVPMFAPDESDGWTCSTSNCNYTGGSSSTRRYNGAPSGTRSYNNYLPDVGSGGLCGPTVTTTIATPAVFTSASHGMSAATQIAFQTSGSLPTGLSTSSTSYYVAPGPTTNTFMLATTSSGTTATIAYNVSNTFTVTKANPAVFTKSSHGLTSGSAIKLSTTGDMYDPLTGGGVYYVRSSGLTTNTFQVSTVSGGSAVNTSTGGTQSGTHSYVREAMFTDSGHGLSVGDPIMFTTTGTLPTGISTNTVYYVRTVPSSSTFTITATSGGAPIFPTGASSGTHSYYELVATSGTQSGSHTYTKIADWTCQSGSANCGGAGNGVSVETAFAGLNISSQAQCKYGTPSNKATASTLTIGGIPGGPNFMCTTAAVTALTTSETDITTAINNEVASGATNITSGIMWGWRLLSPTEPFTEGRAYGEEDNTKVLVLMTDGANTYYPHSSSTYSMLKSWYGAWGFVSMGHLGTTSTTTSDLVTEMNERTALACENVKDGADPDDPNDDILIYTIAFQISDQTTIDMLEDCATDDDMAFQSDNNDELLAAFSAIGDDLSLLRIAQ
jgi:Flp pilus assembly protein TadG